MLSEFFQMDAGVGGTTSRFSDRVLRLLERVEHRCAETHSEKEAVYKLRYEAYIRQRLIAPRADARLFDRTLDDASNARITTTFIDGELASTFRVHVAVDEHDVLPSAGVFSDAIIPHLRMGRVIVDPTRLAARLEFSRRLPEMPYVALRPAWLAAEYFEADYVIATISEEHQAFYRRVFGYEAWCEPRDYPDVNCKIACMGLDFRAAKERVETRYPFFRSTRTERNALFGRWALRRTDPPASPEGRRRVPAE
jgi:hypothetical protein